jgi:phenylacetate-coenzyme A ligase PaaK-like adenylate-forming protein
MKKQIPKEDRYFSKQMETMSRADIIRRIGERIKEMTQVTMEIEAVPQGTLPRFEYKVRRRTDERVEGLERVK